MLGVGTSFGRTVDPRLGPRVGAHRRILHIDVDPNEIGKKLFRGRRPRGRRAPRAAEINYQLERDARWLEQAQDQVRGWRPLRALRPSPRFVDEAACRSEAVPLQPPTRRRRASALLADAILFVDIGNVMAWAPITTPCRSWGFFINMGFGSMGHGSPPPSAANQAQTPGN